VLDSDPPKVRVGPRVVRVTHGSQPGLVQTLDPHWVLEMSICTYIDRIKSAGWGISYLGCRRFYEGAQAQDH
jgi:hypothetical protein